MDIDNFLAIFKKMLPKIYRYLAQVERTIRVSSPAVLCLVRKQKDCLGERGLSHSRYYRHVLEIYNLTGYMRFERAE